MSCPIKFRSESKEICNQALRYWYDEKIKHCMFIEDATKILFEYHQVKKHLEEAFGDQK